MGSASCTGRPFVHSFQLLCIEGVPRCYAPWMVEKIRWVRTLRGVFGALAGLGFLVGCASSDRVATANPGPPQLTLGGHLTDPSAKDANVAVLWVVGDAAYKAGGTQAASGAFSLALTAPPAAALKGGFGIGFVIQLAAGTSLPDGLVADPAAMGVGSPLVTSPQVLIYRAPDAVNPYRSPWPDSFPEGLSCGKCVRATSGGFDSWTPAACESFELAPLPAAEQCNWS